MITVLLVGTKIRLPTGNVIMLLRRDGKDWLCVYQPGSTARGEVHFSGGFLRKFGERIK